MTKEAAIIVGVGARRGIGGATAVKAAQEGMHVFIVGRTKEKLEAIAQEISHLGGTATPVIADCTNADDIQRVFETQQNTGTELKLVIYNAGRNLPAPFLEHDTRIIRDHWQRCVAGAMLVGQAAVNAMQKNKDNQHRGTILYTGASAAMRGKPFFSGFAAGKSAARAMAQSMADEFAPQGIHVAHIVIDGIINGDLIRTVKGVGALLVRNRGQDGTLYPDEIAKAYWMVHQQTPGAWAQEIDLRPFKESF